MQLAQYIKPRLGNMIQVMLALLRSAIIGALLSLTGAALIISIITIPNGGPIVAIYYCFPLLLYVAPLGMFAGAMVKAFTSFAEIRSELRNTSYSGLTPLFWNALAFGIPFVAIGYLILLPYREVGVTGSVVHRAQWVTEVRSNCATQAIILMLVDYSNYDIICSEDLVSYLQTEKPADIPITYRVTYDFGEARSYQLIQAGPISLSWDNVIDSASGCGGPYTPACDSPAANRDSMLYESSWHPPVE